MGVLLTLLPLQDANELRPGAIVHCFNLLNLNDLGIQERLGCGPVGPSVTLQTIPQEMFVVVHNDRLRGKIRSDVYGGELTFVEAGELNKIALPNSISPWDRAVMAFVSTLPPKTPIILYWN